MKIHQLQLTYSAKEDRITLRVNTKTNQELRFFLTRRFIGVFWHALIQVLNKHSDISQGKDNPTIQQIKLEFQHQKAVLHGDYSTEFNSGIEFPLGEKPVLVIAGVITPQKNGLTFLSFSTLRKETISFNLTQDMLHNFCNLIAQTVSKTDWNLQLEGLEKIQSIATEQKNLH